MCAAFNIVIVVQSFYTSTVTVSYSNASILMCADCVASVSGIRTVSDYIY